MNPSSGQARPSPSPGEHTDNDTFPERHYDTPGVEGPESQYSRSFASATQDPGALHGHHDSLNQGYGSTNDYSQYQPTNFHFQAERRALHDRQTSPTASPFALQSDHVILRGIENGAEVTSPSTKSRELGRKETAFLPEHPPTYSMDRRSESVASGSSALPVQSFPHFTTIQQAAQNEQVLMRQTKYTPFRYYFADAVAARDHRRLGTRFERRAYREPDTDDTIADIEINRNLHVERIYNAMTSGEAAKDNRGSIAVKRWVVEAHYPADLVEAYAHKVFDCLLQQAKEGFRGWVHNDYVADERKGEDIDKDVDCAGRLDNIILALEQEKTICEDVMNSACQIRMFVNAPRAYANRKHQNRVGNSKRGRTKDTPDPTPRPTKAARTGVKRARASSATASDMPSSRGSTPQYQQPLQQMASARPYYGRPAFPNLSASPVVANNPAPRSTPLQQSTLSAARNSFRQHSIAAMSPPPTSSPLPPHAPQLQIPRMFAKPSQQQQQQQQQHHSPSAPQPPMSHLHHFTPAMSDEAKTAAAEPPFGDWRDIRNFGESSYPQNEPAVDPMLSQWEFTGRDFTGLPYEQGESSNTFEQASGGYVNLADIERRRSHELGGSSDPSDIRQSWERQHGV